MAGRTHQHGTQRLVDLPRKLAQPHLLAFGPLDPPHRPAVGDRRLSGRARRARRQGRHIDRERRTLLHDLDQANRLRRQCQDKRGLRKCDGAQQRLDVEAVRDLHVRSSAGSAAGRSAASPGTRRPPGRGPAPPRTPRPRSGRPAARGLPRRRVRRLPPPSSCPAASATKFLNSIRAACACSGKGLVAR